MICTIYRGTMHFGELPLDIQEHIYQLHYRGIWSDSVLTELAQFGYRLVGSTFSERVYVDRKTQHYYFDSMQERLDEGSAVVKHNDTNFLHIHSCQLGTQDRLVKDILCYS